MLIVFAVTVTFGVVTISLFFAFRMDLFLRFIRYCKGLQRHLSEGLKKFLRTVGKIFKRKRNRIEIIEEIIIERRAPSRPAHRWFEEEREGQSERSGSELPSDSDEIIIIEESSPPRRRSRSRDRHRGRPSRYSSVSRRASARGWNISAWLPLFGLRRKREIVEVIERRSERRSISPRRHMDWFRGRQRRPARSIVVEERYRRRGSTSSAWNWSGEDARRLAPKRKKWPPWAWFEKGPAPTRRRRESRDIEEPRPTGLKWVEACLIAWFITPLQKLFGLYRTSSESITSANSSYLSYYDSASSRGEVSSESSDRRPRPTRPRGVYAWFIAWFITPLLKLFGLSRASPDRRNSVTSSYFPSEGSATSRVEGRRVEGSNGSSDRRSRRSRRSYR